MAGNGPDKQYVVYNDPIHGTIEVHPLLHKIINTPEFNRLKNIKQLSGKYYVYPGAMHTRFEHSIGVCYIAGEFVRMLCQKQPDLGIEPRDILCVEMAGLCHDLGHGPFSHLFENSVMTKKQIEKWCTTPGEWEHEDLSKRILQRIFVGERSWFTESGIGQDEINMVKKMMHHNAKDIEKEPMNRRFLYEIVANKETGVDVDKWDYFERDCHYTGLSNPFDWRRCMKLSQVIDGSICFRDKEVGNIYDMFRTRSYLHMHVCTHKTGDAIDIMIAEAIRYAGDSGARLLYVKGKSMSIKEVVIETIRDEKLDGFVALTDSILQLITHANSGSDSKVEFGPGFPEDLTLEEKKELLQKAQELLKKLDKREIFHVICTEPLAQFHPHADIEKLLKEVAEAEDVNIASTDLVMKKFKAAYESEGEDPVQKVKFYSKHNLKVPIRRDQIEPKVPELIIPRQFKEEQLRVYWLKRENTKDKESTIKAKVKEGLEKCKIKPKESVRETPDPEN